MGEWISVKDRLPKATEPDVKGRIVFSDNVLVCLHYDEGFNYFITSQCRVDTKKWVCEIPGDGGKVTYWMPIPEPPKEG